MEFKVVPFVAKITSKDSTTQVANQLQTVINSYSQEGWEYLRMDNVETYVEGTNGCFGFGAKPGFVTNYTVLVFRKS